jgi:putative phosphoribosyl transferase
MAMIFEDRRDAGRQLAAALRACRLTRPIVLGLPRGGMPVAAEIAAELAAPLDALVVRKLGAPFNPELAVGAIASGGVCVLNDELAGRPGLVDEAALEKVIRRESAELDRRESAYRGERPFPDLAGRDVVLVDDGMATGATMRAAAEALRALNPASIVAAIPTASASAVARLKPLVDRVVCLDVPAMFSAVGQFYRHFGQTSDDEVRALLESASASDSG